jgi:hypothetical protein
MLNTTPAWSVTDGGGGVITAGAMHPISSELSEQSDCVSHWNDLGMHCLFAHWNSSNLHGPLVGPAEQPSSSELS